MKKSIVRLSKEERKVCAEVIRKLSGSSEKALRARIFLQVDAEGPAWTDRLVAEAFGCRVRTVENVRKRFALEGFEVALQGRVRNPQGGPPKRLDGRQKADLIALRMSETPDGHARWSLRLLARQAVEEGICDSISDQTGQRTPREDGLTARNLRYWVIPPEADGEFAASMEALLRTYERPDSESHPVVCMDERLVPLVRPATTPLAATAQHPQRVDDEYEQAGTAAVFLFFEPLRGWRQVGVRARRTKRDWAQEVAALMEGRYAAAERVTLVLDNLNTHKPGALYGAFGTERAAAILERLELRYTPTHGSWLNVAKCELSCFTRQCLRGRRLGGLESLQVEATAWATSANVQQRAVNWHLTVADARCKLKSIYPKPPE